RSFSVKACADNTTTSSMVASEGLWNCAPRDALSQQSILGSPPCIMVDNIQRGKKSSFMATSSRSCNGTLSMPAQRCLSSESIQVPRNQTLVTSPSGLARRPGSRTLRDLGYLRNRRNVHTTAPKRTFYAKDGALGSELSLGEKRSIVADLRQKTLLRSDVHRLVGAYNRVVSAEALNLLQSGDVIVLFQVLSASHQTEAAHEMMLQMAIDINEIGKQLPQDAFEILAYHAFDELPVEQIKALMWQIQGRRRFIAENIQLCSSNMEMKRLTDLYIQLTNSKLDVDGYSTYFQSRKEKAEGLAKVMIPWIGDEARGGLSPKLVESLLVFLLDRGLSEAVFLSMAQLLREGFQFSHKYYTTAIHRFGCDGQFEYMNTTLDRMRRQGLEPLEDTYSAIIDAHSKAGNLREAQQAYQEILSEGLLPIEQTFGPMLEAVGKMGDFQMTRQLVDQMNASGIRSNEYTLSALLQSLSNDPERSAALMDELSQQIEPNTVNYNILIRTFQRQGDLDGAFKVFRSMSEKKVQPDQYTFSSILSLFAARGDGEGAEAFWKEMVSVHKVVPNVHVYSTMIHVYCTMEDMLSAQAVYREMIQVGIMPNEITFGTLLSAYARRGDLTQMLSIYDSMRAEGLRPNSYIYANLLFGLVKDGDMQAARRLYANMEEDGFGNNVLAQTILMKGYVDQGNLKESLGVYRSMLRSGLVPNFMTYAILMQAYMRRGEKNKGRAVLDKIMSSRGLVLVEGDDSPFIGGDRDGEEPDQDHSKGLEVDSEAASVMAQAKDGSVSRIGTERKPLKLASRPMPLMLYTPLLDAYAKEGNVLAAQEIFEEMKDRGLEPNTVTYTILMDGFRRAGDVDNVLVIWNQLFGRFKAHWKTELGRQESMRPSKKRVMEWVQDRLSTKAAKLQRLLQRPVSISLDSLCYSGRIQEAKVIWDELEKLGFVFDSSNWNDYCIALARNGLVLEACQVMQERLLQSDMDDLVGLDDRTMERADAEESFAPVRKSGRGSYKGRGRYEDMPLESVLPQDKAAKRPANLFYPRPRTFAALADTLEQLLMKDNDRRGGHIRDYILDPIVNDDPYPESSATSVDNEATTESLRLRRLGRQKKLIETKLGSYPNPFKSLDSHHRNILWSLVRTKYPKVLEALNDGMLVAASSQYAGNRYGGSITPTDASTDAWGISDEYGLADQNPSPDTLQHSSKPSKHHHHQQQQQQYSDSRESFEQHPKRFEGFRQWRLLRTVMKDMERRQYLEKRKPAPSKRRYEP
ncbi:hypothetical protein BGW38_005152, partial [Lunasporangiospora selenospora]